MSDSSFRRVRILVTAALAMVCAVRLLAQEPAPFRLCPPTRHKELVSLIPATDDPWFERLRKDPRLVVYTQAEMPKASQFWDNNPLAGVHSASYNLSANSMPKYDGGRTGGPGQEHPWRTPFGLDDAEGWSKFTFWLPAGPVTWWRERMPGDGAQHATYRWEFPVGTVFGEVLCVGHPKGWSVPFEVRVRRKVGHGTWRPDVYRPFHSRAEYDRAAAALGEVTGQNRVRTLTLRNPQPIHIISGTAAEDVLDALPADVVAVLLDRPFKSVRGHEWVPGGHAPTTAAPFGIVPKGYAGATVAVTTHSCARCHKTALGHPDEFDIPTRDWYGRVPGDDQIFTWHPFDPASVSPNGSPRPVYLRQELIRAGLLKQWGEP